MLQLLTQKEPNLRRGYYSNTHRYGALFLDITREIKSTYQASFTNFTRRGHSFVPATKKKRE